MLSFAFNNTRFNNRDKLAVDALIEFSVNWQSTCCQARRLHWCYAPNPVPHFVLRGKKASIDNPSIPTCKHAGEDMESWTLTSPIRLPFNISCESVAPQLCHHHSTVHHHETQLWLLIGGQQGRLNRRLFEKSPPKVPNVLPRTPKSGGDPVVPSWHDQG